MGWMGKRFAACVAGAAVLGGVVLVDATTVSAAGETFEVVSVNAPGCTSGAFGMTVKRSNLDGGAYTVRTVVTVDDLVYMNEQASISVNGNSGWSVFNNFTYGPVPNQGTYPIPTGRPMRLDFTLERPKGTVLHAWTLKVDGCDTANIVSNGVTQHDMGVAISAVGGPFGPGATVPFTVDVTNPGDASGPNSTVSVALPPQLVAASITDVVAPSPYTCATDLGGGTINCTAPLHPVGVSAKITFNARLVPTLLALGEQAVVQATVSSGLPDVVPANNTASVNVAPPTFVAITPIRVLDTRGLGSGVPADSTVKVPITSLDSIPDVATSVVVNLTSTQTRDAGFLTLHACSTARPNTSNSNFQPGADTANLTISAIGTDGSICLYTSGAAQLIVDVIGYTTAGFAPTAPQRLADTRAAGKPIAGSTVRVPLPPGQAHVLSVTSTRSGASGFLTVHDCGDTRPATSNLNFAAGVDIANLIVLAADVELCVYTSAPTDIVVDHLGAVSNATGALDRLVDTRSGAPAVKGATIPIPAIASTNPTAAINLTATGTTTAGYLTVHACNLPVPATSNLNVSPGRDIANLVIIPTGTPMCVSVQADTHVLVDLLSTIN